MPMIQHSRRQGIEFSLPRQAAAYVLSHPRTLATTTALSTSLIELGPYVTAGIVGGTTATAFCLYRAAPRTWDRFIGPHVAAWWRRWAFYQRRWQRAANGCDLSKLDKLTGELRVPRIRKVKVRHSWDVIYVRMLPGQKVADYEEVAEALAGCFKADRVATQKIAPHEVALLVERRDPFGLTATPVPASPIPEATELADLSNVDVGAGEDGAAFEIGLLDNHVLTTAVTRAGKSGLIWNPLRALAPMIRDGLVQVNAADLKGGVEMDAGLPLFYRYARDPRGCLRMLRKVLEDMNERQERIRRDGRRKFSLSVDEPFVLIMIDELLVMSQFAERKELLEFHKIIGVILTQGAGLGFCVMGYVQDPTVDAVPMRKLFPTKIALRLDSDTHVDMVLGDGKRLLGALADQIPASQPGVGYAVEDGRREPRRFRLGLVEDGDITELATGYPAPVQADVFEPDTAVEIA